MIFIDVFREIAFVHFFIFFQPEFIEHSFEFGIVRDVIDVAINKTDIVHSLT